jgi:hypothetical protein
MRSSCAVLPLLILAVSIELVPSIVDKLDGYQPFLILTGNGVDRSSWVLRFEPLGLAFDLFREVVFIPVLKDHVFAHTIGEGDLYLLIRLSGFFCFLANYGSKRCLRT